MVARKKTTGSRPSSPSPVGRKAKSGPPCPAAALTSKDTRPAAALTSKDLTHFRNLLLAKRRELLGAMGGLAAEASDGGSGGGSASYSPSSDDPAESGWLCQKADITAGLLANEQQMLRDIDDALGRIASRTYGICEGTGQPIHKPRLEARPWARYCIEYARKIEQQLRRGSVESRRDPYTPPPADGDGENEPDDDPPDLPVPMNLKLEEEDDGDEGEGEGEGEEP